MRVVATIDQAALAHNLAVARRQAAGSRVYAVVKADAYGHGLTNLGHAFDAADALAVACMDEAREVREIMPGRQILVLEGVFSGAELSRARQQRFELVVHAPWQLRLLEKDGVEGIERVWLKFDTGMHRLGFPPAMASGLRERLDALGVVQPGIMTHLACADEPGREDTREQLQVLEGLRAVFPGSQVSSANSAGVLLHPSTHGDWVRPGLMLYGVSPLPGGHGEALGLRPAMTLSARLMAIQDVAAGERVGYGATWQAPADCRIGIVSIGYGDGYPWREQGVGHVVIRGRQVPLAGRISMDMLGVDLTTLPEARAGDEVVLWGPELPVEQVARAVDTSPYELVCRVSRRVPRRSIELETPLTADVSA
jgi:alanine racemase